jgi:hypothetical protein
LPPVTIVSLPVAQHNSSQKPFMADFNVPGFDIRFQELGAANQPPSQHLLQECKRHPDVAAESTPSTAA